VIECELEGVAHVVADYRGRAAEGADETDLDGFLLGHDGAHREHQTSARNQ